MARFPTCEFWDFSLAVYGREGVPAACLALQERHGADVNLLLFCCWHARSGRGALAGEDLRRAAAAVEPWHGRLVRGLRAVRVRLRRESAPLPQPTDALLAELAEALRKKIAAVELEAEHIEQLILAASARPVSSESAAVPLAARARDAAEGALAYLALLGAPLDSADRSDLFAVLAGVFPELGKGELESILVRRAPRGASRAGPP
ncbi:MAG: TIGR02444 family protein [Alphaproteobacteria bacterium]